MQNIIISNNYLTHLKKTRPFSFLASTLWEQRGVLPSSLEVKGCKELVFDFEYKGTGLTVCCQAVWDFRWHRFYFVINTFAPFHFRRNSFSDSPLLTEREFLSEIESLENNPDFERIETKDMKLDSQECEFILSECQI